MLGEASCSELFELESSRAASSTRPDRFSGLGHLSQPLLLSRAARPSRCQVLLMRNCYCYGLLRTLGLARRPSSPSPTAVTPGKCASCSPPALPHCMQIHRPGHTKVLESCTHFQSTRRRYSRSPSGWSEAAALRHSRRQRPRKRARLCPVVWPDLSGKPTGRLARKHQM